MASVTKVYGALTAQFGISYTDQKFMNEELDGLIGASVYCVHTLKACLAGVCDDEHADTIKRMETVKEQAKLFNGAFKTTEGSASRPNTTSTYSHLGKTWLQRHWMMHYLSFQYPFSQNLHCTTSES